MEWLPWLEVIVLGALVLNLTRTAFFLRKAERKRRELANLLSRRVHRHRIF